MILEKIIEIVKKKKIIYTIDHECIVLHTGTLCLYLQFEKTKNSDDYDHVQVWISDDDNSDNIDLNHQYYENITVNEIEHILDESLESLKELTKVYSKIVNKFKDIENIVNENDFPIQIIDMLYNKLNFR